MVDIEELPEVGEWLEEIELEFNAFYGDKENEHALLERMHPLIEEVKRLREWENRIRTYFGDEQMMDFYDWVKKIWGDEE